MAPFEGSRTVVCAFCFSAARNTKAGAVIPFQEASLPSRAPRSLASTSSVLLAVSLPREIGIFDERWVGRMDRTSTPGAVPLPSCKLCTVLDHTQSSACPGTERPMGSMGSNALVDFGISSEHGMLFNFRPRGHRRKSKHTILRRLDNGLRRVDTRQNGNWTRPPKSLRQGSRLYSCASWVDV